MITIALAAYNGEKYIEEQLDSLIEQDIDEDLSIVVADDGSADKTFGILCDYVERYPGLINAAVNEVPTGSAKGNFFGLLRSIDDDYVMLCDQDDVWNADKVRVTFERMKKLEAKYGKDTPLLVFGDVEVVDEGLNVISESMARYQKTAPHHNGLNHYLVQNNIIGCTVMINRALLNYTKYEPKVCMMHDWWLGLLASAFGHISFIDRPLMKYRQHGNNQMGTRAASDTSQYIERLSKGEEVRRNYDIMFKQAELFLERYENELSSEQINLIKGFLSLRQSSRIKKIYKIFKYRLFKSTWFWTLGQCLSI